MMAANCWQKTVPFLPAISWNSTRKIGRIDASDFPGGIPALAHKSETSTATKFEMARPIFPRKCFLLVLALHDLWPWHSVNVREPFRVFLTYYRIVPKVSCLDHARTPGPDTGQRHGILLSPRCCWELDSRASRANCLFCFMALLL